KGRVVHVSSTSASAPIFASLIAAVNDACLAAGKGPVGSSSCGKSFFPSSGSIAALLDLIRGRTDGFSAAPGWDPVSGLGTPNFVKLRDAFL
ncbi:hypothetical protein B0H14DRAFT_2205773, partial [Mycena olivaceomarginata]